MKENEKYWIKKFLFLIRPNAYDKFTCDEVIKRNVYFRDFPIKSKEKWLDIGAHIGSFSILVKSLGCDVIAYEPNKENFLMAKENFKLNNYDIPIFNLAVVGNNDNKRLLYLNTNRNMGSHSFYINKRRTKKEWVNCVNINSIITDEIDGMKIDTEGCEYEIIKAIRDFKNLKKIVFEYHFNILGEKRYFELINILSKNNFKLKYKKNVDKNWYLLVKAIR